jgi:hypothetical protein
MGGKRRMISMEALGKFSIDEDMILYWDGELVQTMAKYSLSWWQQAALIAGSVAAIVAAAATVGIFLQGAHVI